MTAERFLTLYCDADDCEEFFDSGETLERVARREAERDGWGYVNGSDYCRTHLRQWGGG